MKVTVELRNPLPEAVIWQAGIVPPGEVSHIYPWGKYVPVSVTSRTADIPYAPVDRFSFWLQGDTPGVIIDSISVENVTFKPGVT